MFHQFECYPPSEYQPYWVIFLGFITSYMITKSIFYSGSGLISIIRSAFQCQCCQEIDEKQYDLNDKNKWKKFPNFIEISSLNPFHSQTNAAEIYGIYTIQKHKQNSPPFYKSTTTTTDTLCGDESHVIGAQRLILRYSDEYGWVLFSNEFRNVQYKMIQLSDQKLANLNCPSSTSLDKLTPKIQKWRLYAVDEQALDQNYWKRNVVHSKFAYNEAASIVKHLEYMRQNAAQEFIQFHTLPLFRHNVVEGRYIDMNGRYILDKVDYQPGRKRMYYFFKHEHDEVLGVRYRIKWEDERHNNRSFQCRILYQGYVPHTTLVEFNAVNGEDGRRNDNYKGNMYSFNKYIDVLFKFEAKNRIKYYMGNLWQFLFVALFIYQFIKDMSIFHQYVGSNHNGWDKYQCFSFIITNSPNMKHLHIFFAIGFKRLKLTFRFFLVFGYMYLGLFMPSMITHWLPFGLAYIWFTVIFELWLCAIFIASLGDSKSIYQKSTPFKQALYLGTLAGICYIFVILNVPIMSNLYEQKNYMDSFVDVLSVRRTSDWWKQQKNNIYEFEALLQFVMWWI